MTPPPCAHCPRAGRNLAGECPGLCAWTDPAAPHYSPAAVWRACGYQPGQAGLPDWLPPLTPGPAPATPAAPVPPPPAKPEPRGRLWWIPLAVLECDYRFARESCGCDGRQVCGLRRGPFSAEPELVSLSDCVDCVRRSSSA